MARNGVQWWGSFTLGEGETAHFGLGPLRLWVERRSGEWRICCRTELDHGTSGVLVEVPAAFPAPESDVETYRFATPEREGELALKGSGRARSVRHILAHLDLYLSACQLGITLASLVLGWLAEPAVAALIVRGASALGIEVGTPERCTRSPWPSRWRSSPCCT